MLKKLEYLAYHHAKMEQGSFAGGMTVVWFFFIAYIALFAAIEKLIFGKAFFHVGDIIMMTLIGIYIYLYWVACKYVRSKEEK